MVTSGTGGCILPHFLVDDPEAVEAEVFLALAQSGPEHQFQGGFGPFELKALEFQFLDAVQGFRHHRVFGGKVQAEVPGLEDDVAFAREFRHRDVPGIAHRFRVDVFVGPGVALHRGGVHAPLVGKGALAHVGLIAVGAHVGQLIDKAGEFAEALEVGLTEAIYAHLELQIGDDGAEIGVAAALPHAVDGPLDLVAARLHRGQGVGHRQLGVVVGVDAQGDLGKALFHGFDDLHQVRGDGAAVGVAEHQTLGAALHRGLQGLKA